MREIKFRGKSLITDKWVYGDSIKHTDNAAGSELLGITYIGHKIPNARKAGKMKWIPVAISSIGQYIGYRDKYAREIYEGDILRFGSTEAGICEIKWNDEVCAFCHRFYYQEEEPTRPVGPLLDIEPDVEIIGNVRDNYNLLERYD